MAMNYPVSDEYDSNSVHNQTLLPDKLIWEFMMSEQIKAFIDLLAEDPLTKLPNRKTFVDELERYIRLSERYEVPLTMARLDIDHFSILEKTFGLQAANAILADFASAIRGRIRDTDLLARWSEDEFIWLMPHTDVEGAVIAAEKMRRHILSSNFPYVGKLTASFGICRHYSGETIAHFVGRTSDQKEVAKNEGRNRVAASSD